MLLQWPGWRSTGLALPPNPVGSRESESRVRPDPLRGPGALAVLEQARGVTGLTPAAVHSPSPQWWGWAPPWGVGAAAQGREPRAHDGAVPLCQGVKCPCTGAGARVRGALERGGPRPRAGRTLERGGTRSRGSEPSSGAEPARGKCCPSNGAEPA
jgi:hypothetical protein